MSEVGESGDKNDIMEVISWREKGSDRYIDVNPVLKILMRGMYDASCVLYLLQGSPNLLQKIWNDVI